MGESDGRRQHSGHVAWGRLLVPVVLVLAMLGVIGAIGAYDATFPELSALAVGTLYFRRPDWCYRRWDLFWFPTAASLLAVTLERWAGWPSWLDAIVVGSVTLVALAVADSPAMPAVSAGLLPVLLGISSLLYPLTVGTATALVAVLVGSARTRSVPAERGRSRPKEPRRWTWRRLLPMLGLLWFGIGLAGGVGTPLLAAPPLFVFAYEQLAAGRQVGAQRVETRSGHAAGGSSRYRVPAVLAGRVIWLGIAGGVGVATRLAFDDRTLGALLAFSLMLLLLLWRRSNLLPVLPLAILPSLLPSSLLITYTWAVPSGALVLGLVATLLGGLPDARLPRGGARSSSVPGHPLSERRDHGGREHRRGWARTKQSTSMSCAPRRRRCAGRC